MGYFNDLCIGFYDRFLLTWFCFISQHNAELNVQISTLSYSERELMDANGRLRESLERVREELRSARTQMERTQQEAERYNLKKKNKTKRTGAVWGCILQASRNTLCSSVHPVALNIL